MGGYADKLQARAGEMLEPGEQIVSAVRTMARGTTMGRALGGLAGEAIAHRQASKGHAQQAEGSMAEGWPSGNNAVGLTAQRLVIFNYTAMGKPKDLVGEFPLEQVASVEVEKKKLGANALRFSFGDGSSVEVECAKLEKTGDFVEAFNRTKTGA
ncbi:MAG TPA: hypothetical protein VEA19_06975 [Actinomycetota bacterium]|nr:hypothetical protein [Actinomycetota bacterium]